MLRESPDVMHWVDSFIKGLFVYTKGPFYFNKTRAYPHDKQRQT